MPDDDLVSIIIPNRNRLTALFRAVDSALKQDYDRKEIIIVDDSNDEIHSKIVSQYKGVDQVKVIRGDNKGDLAARRKGFYNSNGSYIAFLDSDDLWLTDKLRLTLKMWEKDPELGLVFDRWSLCTLVGNNLNCIPSNFDFLCKDYGPQDQLSSKFAREMWVSMIKAVARKFLPAFHSESMQSMLDQTSAACQDYMVFNPPLVYFLLARGNFIHMSSIVTTRKVISSLGGMPLVDPMDYSLSIKISRKYKVGFVNKTLTLKVLDGDNIRLGLSKRRIVHELLSITIFKLFNYPITLSMPILFHSLIYLKDILTS